MISDKGITFHDTMMASSPEYQLGFKHGQADLIAKLEKLKEKEYIGQLPPFENGGL